MKRNLLTGVMTALVLAGCGSNDITTGGRALSVRESAAMPASVADHDVAVKDEEAAVTGSYTLSTPSYENYGSGNQSYDLALHFSEGRAWAMYFDENNDRILALIDETGNVVFKVSQKALVENNGFESSHVGTTPVENGVTCIYAHSMTGWIGHGFLILDKDGNVLYNADDGDSSTESYLLGYGEGSFLVETISKGFSETSDQFYVMDAHGNVTGTPKSLKKQLQHTWFSFLGENIFCSEYYAYNRAADTLFSLDHCTISRPFVNGLTVTDSGNIISVKDLENAESFSAYRRSENRREHEKEGVFYRPTETYVKEPSYGENVKVVGDTTFFGDYAAVYYVGADNRHYVTLMDQYGQAQYDPVPIDELPNENAFSFYHSTKGFRSWEGYILARINNETVIITPDGRVLPKEDASLAGVFSDDTWLSGHHYTLRGTFFNYTHDNGFGFARAGGGARIEEVRVTTATKSM